MKSSKFTESQIIKALKENENGKTAEQISRELGINKATFYNWRKQYGGMEVSQLAYSGQTEPSIPVQTEPPIPEQSEPPLRMI